MRGEAQQGSLNGDGFVVSDESVTAALRGRPTRFVPMKLKLFDLAIFAGCVAAVGMAVVYQEMGRGLNGYDGNPFKAIGRACRGVWDKVTGETIACVYPPRAITDTVNLVPLVLKFEAQHRRLPTNEEGLSALVKVRADSKAGWHPLMLELPADSWGRSYHYRTPATRWGGRFEIFSLGQDGVESADDIGCGEPIRGAPAEVVKGELF